MQACRVCGRVNIYIRIYCAIIVAAENVFDQLIRYMLALQHCYVDDVVLIGRFHVSEYLHTIRNAKQHTGYASGRLDLPTVVAINMLQTIVHKQTMSV